MWRRQIGVLLLVIIAVALASRWKRSGSEEYEIPPGWSLNGVSLGDTYDQVRELYGRPSGGWQDEKLWKVSNWGPFHQVWMARQDDLEWRVYGMSGKDLGKDGRLVTSLDSSWTDATSLSGEGVQKGTALQYHFPEGPALMVQGAMCDETELTFVKKNGKILEIDLESVSHE